MRYSKYSLPSVQIFKNKEKQWYYGVQAILFAGNITVELGWFECHNSGPGVTVKKGKHRHNTDAATKVIQYPTHSYKQIKLDLNFA